MGMYCGTPRNSWVFLGCCCFGLGFFLGGRGVNVHKYHVLVRGGLFFLARKAVAVDTKYRIQNILFIPSG